MFKKVSHYLLAGAVFLIVGCGLKVINPNEPNNKGTLAVDVSGGSLKLVETYTCKLESMGKRFYGVAKSESAARDEALAKCRDNSVLSFCKPENTQCEKN